MTNPQPAAGLTGLGKLISALLVIGLVGLGGYMVWKHMGAGAAAPAGQFAGGDGGAGGAGGGAKANGNGPVGNGGGGAAGNGGGTDVQAAALPLTDTKTAVPTLDLPGTYVPKDNVVDVELSQYAGYSGLIVANGGLDPNADSVFQKKFGFKVRIRLVEDEGSGRLNSGKLAVSATTVDALAVMGRQFNVVVPAQISYSRGADGIVVRSDIKRINQLQGKIVAAASQFYEADFLIRYLATQSNLGVNLLPDLNAAPAPDKINLVYCDDGEAAGKALVLDAKSANPRLAGGVTWAPFTTSAVSDSGGKLHLLTTTRNLLVIADILVVNKGFATDHPDMVNGLVAGLLEGNRLVTEHPEQFADLLAKSFSAKDDKWDRAKALAELQKVHLSNLPENEAFFKAGIADGGSFASIYQSAVLAYGNDLLPNPVDSDHFVAMDALKKAESDDALKGETASITPLAASASGPIEQDPLLTRDVKFYFKENSSDLDMANNDNLTGLDSVKKMLDVSPGSRILLRGHVDNSMIETFRKSGGESYVQKMALVAMQLSKDRANEVKQRLVQREKVDANRIDTVGRGWEEPVSTTDPEKNRRVEVQWFTLE